MLFPLFIGRICAFALILVCATVAIAGEPTTKSNATDPELRAEVLRRVKVDQDARFALIEWEKSHAQAAGPHASGNNPEREKLRAAVMNADRENTAWLSALVEKQGWPTKKQLGRDGANAAWLMVQHGDADVAFQRKCLDLMAKLPKSEVSQTDLAYLTDRVLLAEGKKQIYGTQFMVIDGKFQPRPMEDPDNVDTRRAEVGMIPLAEYVRQLELLYGTPAEK